MRLTGIQRILVAASLLCASLAASAGVGFDNQFKLRSGDLNGDGRTDLYLRWTPKVVPIVLDDITIPVPLQKRDVQDFVLQQNADGSFSLVNNLSGSQLQTASGWPVVTNPAVRASAYDVNFDGKIDLIIRGIKAIIAGANTQIIYASSTPGTAPASVRGLNTNVKTFYKDVAKWWLAPVVTQVISYVNWYYLGYSVEYYNPYACLGYDVCTYDYDPYAQVYYYYGGIISTVQRKYHDYGMPANSPAFRFADKFFAMDEQGEVNVPSSGVDILQQILNGIWGTPDPIIIGQPPPKGIDPDLGNDWNWKVVTKHLLGIFWEVCFEDEGDTVGQCWLDIAAPGFRPLTMCATHGPYEDNGPYFNYAITADQRTKNAANQRRPFWVSRYESCDPFAPSALGVVDDRGLGHVTLRWLRAIAKDKGIQFNEEELGRKIMHEHVTVTDRDEQQHTSIPALLSKRQITDYHQKVFAEYGFPDYTFGGAPYSDDTWGGRAMQDFLGAAFWCPDCDKYPE